MDCPKCSTQNEDNAWRCINCGNVLPHEAQEPQPPPIKINNHLIFAVLCTVFCCVPLGIPAIIYAAQVNEKAATGDIQGAMNSSQKAKFWAWLAFILGCIIGIFYIAIIILDIVSNQ
jgi:hypothetical protein